MHKTNLWYHYQPSVWSGDLHRFCSILFFFCVIFFLCAFISSLCFCQNEMRNIWHFHLIKNLSHSWVVFRCRNKMLNTLATRLVRICCKCCVFRPATGCSAKVRWSKSFVSALKQFKCWKVIYQLNSQLIEWHPKMKSKIFETSLLFTSKNMGPLSMYVTELIADRTSTVPKSVLH